MAYCKNCGANIDDKAVICPSCGATQDKPQQAAEEKNVFLWGVLGFFVPIAGLILYLMWKQTKPQSAKKAGMGALISVGINVVFMILNVVLSACMQMG